MMTIGDKNDGDGNPTKADETATDMDSNSDNANNSQPTVDSNAGDENRSLDTDDQTQVAAVEDPEDYSTQGEHSEVTDLKGTFNYITIGITYSHLAVNKDNEPLPQWGLGIFFDYQFIPMKFKDPIPNSLGGMYRPEMRFWTREDAIAFALEKAGNFRFMLDKKHFGTRTIPEHNIDPISQCIEYANNSGLRINNMIQREDGSWIANIRVDYYSNFGEGETPVEALEDVVDKAVHELNSKYHRTRLKK